ncbi:MAG TPA: matrixin family metalloprotease [Planctomycetota bacterium]
MKNSFRILAGVALVAGSASFVIPSDATAYSVLGFNLGLNERDARLFNNFTAVTANNNTTIDPNWPAYDGAELALWKGCAEWGSIAHGDGSGDPTQGNVGDGGSNFSFVWNGNASGTGSIGHNIISQIGGSSGGVLAFMQGDANGWWVRFYQGWTWQDGPGAISTGFDLQSVGCHEVGHSLGLGHSTVNGATMYPSIGQGSESERSIENDDKNGVKAVYGTRNAAVNATIDSIQGSTAAGGTMIVVGTNYSATGNEVWFNSSILDGGETGGDPFKITGLASAGGQISVTVPSSGIEDGSIHVRRGGGGSGQQSESHPFERGGVSTDTILLQGPATANVGQGVTFNISLGPANAFYALIYSTSNTGTTIGGHPFDVGNSWTVAATGTLSGTGTASLNRTVPAAASGRTFYLEVGADDNGTIYDSNLLALTVN